MKASQGAERDVPASSAVATMTDPYPRHHGLASFAVATSPSYGLSNTFPITLPLSSIAWRGRPRPVSAWHGLQPRIPRGTSGSQPAIISSARGMSSQRRRRSACASGTPRHWAHHQLEGALKRVQLLRQTAAGSGRAPCLDGPRPAARATCGGRVVATGNGSGLVDVSTRPGPR